MSDERRSFGIRGELLAREFLEGKGHTVLAVNFRVKFGELDLVTRDGETVVFVEVRTRCHDIFGHPLESVGPGKRRRLGRLAEFFLLERFGTTSVACRFDIIAIVATGSDEPQIVHLENAFPAL